MNGFEYQIAAERTMGMHTKTEERLLNAALGLIGETGEVADIIKKWRFHGHELDRNELFKELGDIQWYIAQACAGLDISTGVIESGIFAFIPPYGVQFDFSDEVTTRVLKMSVKAGQVGSLVNQWLFSGQSTPTLDGEVLKTHLLAIQSLLVELCMLFDTTIQSVRQTNIDKLKARYGEEGFTHKASINRVN